MTIAPPAQASWSTAGNKNDSPMDYHAPVLPAEVLEILQPRPGRFFLDGTLGGGGHTSLLLEAGARVIGLDQDPDALAAARSRLAVYGDRFTALAGNFRQAPALLASLGLSSVDGILLDLGVSSHQLDCPERGFSFQRNGPLDMRMAQDTGLSAADIINSAPVEELVRIFRDYGEEPRSARIASRIAQLRHQRTFQTTFDLVAAVESVIHRQGPRHPATRIFQGLRIAVNDELGALAEFLNHAADLLTPGGRLALIAFHSLEDRMIKRYLRKHSTPEIDRPEWPAPRKNPDCCFRLLFSAPLTASPDELLHNPRSRSAKLRGAEKLPHRP